MFSFSFNKSGGPINNNVGNTNKSGGPINNNLGNTNKSSSTLNNNGGTTNKSGGAINNGSGRKVEARHGFCHFSFLPKCCETAGFS
jgi:hypothetical protein